MRDRLAVAELPPLHDVRGAKMLRDLGGERLGVDFVAELEDTFKDVAEMRSRSASGFRRMIADARRGAPCGG